MYCHHCTRSFAEDAIYCSQCGRKLSHHKISGDQRVGIWSSDHEPLDTEIVDSKQEQIQLHHAEAKGVNKRPKLKAIHGIIMIVCMLVITFGVVYLFYLHEESVNEQALNLQIQAKTAALNGEYEQALHSIEEAIALRPKFEALTADENIIHEAIRLERLAADLEEIIEKGLRNEAELQLEALKTELSGYKEPLFDRQREKLEELNMKYTVLSLTNELSNITSIRKLGNLLNVVNGLMGEEAEVLREQIKDRIRTTTDAEVKSLLSQWKYNSALSIIDTSLGWINGDDHLLNLKQKVKTEQAEYEFAEQQRIERAMELAAAEDYINRTAAIELISTEQMMNELGEIVIVVSLKNVATRSIYDVKVSYTIESEDTELVNGTSLVTPDYVEAGEPMSFSVTLSDVYEYVDSLKVNINESSWELE